MWCPPDDDFIDFAEQYNREIEEFYLDTAQSHTAMLDTTQSQID
jgi:hypothetical protein